MVKYMAVDPGKTTGWAVFDNEGMVITHGQAIGREAFYEVLFAHAPELIIIEDFILFSHKAKAQTGSKFEEVRVIGACEMYAKMTGGKTVLQQPAIKSVGYMWAGIPKAKSHALSHEKDAYIHGVYYLQKNGIRKPQANNLAQKLKNPTGDIV